MTGDNHVSDPLEDRILSFIGEHWPAPRRHKLSVNTRLVQDLGMDGDDAVEFFKTFGEEFNVSLDGLHARWHQHFGPEGIPLTYSLGFIVLVWLCFEAGFLFHDRIGVLPAWGWGTALMGIAIFIYHRWFAKDAMLPITVLDLVESARAGLWIKPYPDRW
jgi:hypothetical protein